MPPHYSHANKIQMTAESTEQKKNQKNNADLLELNQTVFSSLTSSAAEITVTKSFSLLEHPAQHVFIFSKHTALLNAQQSTQPFLCNTWTERYNSLLTTIIIISVAKQLHTYLRAANKTRHALLLFLALPFICFSPHFQQIRSQYSCACASPQSGMHLEKASSNSDWRQAGRQREREKVREGAEH